MEPGKILTVSLAPARHDSMRVIKPERSESRCRGVSWHAWIKEHARAENSSSPWWACKICAPGSGVWICICAWPCHQAPALDQSETTELRLLVAETAASAVNYTAANRSRGAPLLRPVSRAFKQINKEAAHTPPPFHTHTHAHTFSHKAKSQRVKDNLE